MEKFVFLYSTIMNLYSALEYACNVRETTERRML